MNIAKRVLRPSVNSGCVKIASAMSIANERLLDRVRHFVEPRRILQSTFIQCHVGGLFVL